MKEATDFLPLVGDLVIISVLAISGVRLAMSTPRLRLARYRLIAAYAAGLILWAFATTRGDELVEKMVLYLVAVFFAGIVVAIRSRTRG